MDDPLPVCRRKRFGDGDSNLQRFVQRQRAFAKALRKSLSFEKLHHQIVCVVLRSDVVEMTDVRMVQRGDGPGFALHALFQFRRRGEMRRQDFDLDGSIQAEILCARDLAHATSAKWRLDFIRSNFRAGSKSHKWAKL